MMIWSNHPAGRSPKNAFIIVRTTTKIASHGSVGVKLDAMLTTRLKVQGFQFNPPGLHLTVVGSCLWGCNWMLERCKLLILFLLCSRRSVSWFLGTGPIGSRRASVVIQMS